MGDSNYLCLFWGKSIYLVIYLLHFYNWSSIQKAGKKNPDLQKWSGKSLMCRSFTFKPIFLMIYDVYTKNNDFYYFHLAILSSFVPQYIFFIKWTLTAHLTIKRCPGIFVLLHFFKKRFQFFSKRNRMWCSSTKN